MEVLWYGERFTEVNERTRRGRIGRRRKVEGAEG